MNIALDTSPAALSGVVRNLVIARAAAGVYDSRETTPQALRACRAVARQRIGTRRLSPAQAAEVDALAMAVRGQTIRSPEAIVSAAPADQTAILAALVRIEKLLMALVALLCKRFAGPQIVEMPVSMLGGGATGREIEVRRSAEMAQ